MSKAFLFIALALVIALATAKSFTTTTVAAGFDPSDADSKCKDLVYEAASKFWIVGSFTDYADWKAKNEDCDAELADGVDAPLFIEDTIAANAACFTAKTAGAASACGIATGDACTAAATEYCVTDNQCVEKVCTVQPRYVWKFEAVTAAADVPAAITKIIETLPSAADKEVFPCKDSAPKIAVVDQTASPGTGKWFLTSWTDLTPACQAVLFSVTPTTLIPTNVQQNTCTTCAPWAGRFETGSSYFTCPCKDADTIISQSRWKLVENVKLQKAKDFWKTNACLVSVNFVVAEEGQFVLQTETKTSDDCTKADPDADKKAEELKLIATAVTDADVVKVTSLAADCVTGGKWKCATDEKCASLRCAKGAACSTAADAAVVCAGKCVAEKEGETAGKCNSASVVGYVVAVVAVIAAFVF